MSKDRAKFDIDLQYGQAGERWLTWLGTDQAKVEVKTERDTWATTGNACFEYRCRGKASGIAITASDYWIHLFKLGETTHMGFIWSVDDLKQFLRICITTKGYAGSRVVQGGDDDQSTVILVPITELWRVSTIGLPIGAKTKPVDSDNRPD
jgi:hypothetical protein